MEAGEQSLAMLPLPLPSDYFLAVQAIDESIERKGLRKGLEGRMVKYANNRPFGGLRLAAYGLLHQQLLENGRQLEPGSKTPEIFYDGVLTGTAIVHYAHHAGVPFASLVEESQPGKVGSSLFEDANEGLERMGQSTLEIISDIAAKHISLEYGNEHLQQLHVLLRGCGYVVLRAANSHKAILEASMAEFVADLEHIEQEGHDWDSELQRLNNPSEND